MNIIHVHKTEEYVEIETVCQPTSNENDLNNCKYMPQCCSTRPQLTPHSLE